MIEATTRIKQLTDDELKSVNLEGIFSAFKASGQQITSKDANDINDFMLPYLRENYSSLHVCFLQKAYKNGIIGDEGYATGKLCPAIFLKWINRISFEMQRAHQQENNYESEQKRRQTIDTVKYSGKTGLAVLLRYYFLEKGVAIPGLEERIAIVEKGGEELKKMLAIATTADWSKSIVKKVNDIRK